MEIDVIIPCYNAKETLFKTLSSIAIQRNVDRLHVYLVNDCSKYKYDDFINYFSAYLDIQEIDLEENVGPGEARNVGIKKSHSPYLTFIDSDDYFYSPYSLYSLMKEITTKNCDEVISNFIYERDGERTIKERNTIWLHGKVYKRSFLEDHSIFFNNTRANEDNGFNQLIGLLNPNVSYLDEVTYVYSENKESITRKNNRLYKFTGLEGYAYNIQWAIEEGIQRKGDPFNILCLSYITLLAMYYYYLDLQNEYDVSKILTWSKPIWKIYSSSKLTLPEDGRRFFISRKEEEYKDVCLKRSISFEEFLEKVGEVND